MYGLSFLVYERSTGRFLEFFCGSKSTRSERAKSINLYAEVNASVRKNLESSIFAGKIAEKFFGGPL